MMPLKMPLKRKVPTNLGGFVARTSRTMPVQAGNGIRHAGYGQERLVEGLMPVIFMPNCCWAVTMAPPVSADEAVRPDAQSEQTKPRMHPVALDPRWP